MSGPIKSPTADCLYCGKQIRQNSVGGWWARGRSDPTPPFCDLSPDGYHAPSPTPALTEGQRIMEESLLDPSQDLP